VDYFAVKSRLTEPAKRKTGEEFAAAVMVVLRVELSWAMLYYYFVVKRTMTSIHRHF